MSTGALPSIELRLPAGVTLLIPAELAAELEATLHALHRRASEQRNLAAEIEGFLTQHAGASAIEIARGISARDHDVRATLRANSRFQNVPPPPGRSKRLRAWMIAPTPAQAVPRHGTSSPATRGERP
jgi:hypothetical protein